MKWLLLIGVAAVSASGCKVLHARIQGSGNLSTRTVAIGKEVKPFTQIETNGAYDLIVSQGPQSDLKITGDDNIITAVKLTNEGDKLVIGMEDDYTSSNKLRIEVTMPKVAGIAINGSGTAKVAKIQGDNLALAINGSGEMDVDGAVEALDISISGSAEIDASDLRAADVQTSISGSGSIQTSAEKTLSASISGSGEIRYKGQPKVSKSIAGSGEVSPL
jgi:hypothetical protein